MQASIVTNVAAVGLYGLAGLVMGVGFYDVGETIISDKRGLELDYVYYDQSRRLFIQRVKPIGWEVVQGEWAASISRNGEILCSGAGKAPYSGKEKAMTPDVWTGGDCPPLKPDDVAIASWDFKNENGQTVTISAEFTIGENNAE